jgi:hypothetical protein
LYKTHTSLFQYGAVNSYSHQKRKHHWLYSKFIKNNELVPVQAKAGMLMCPCAVFFDSKKRWGHRRLGSTESGSVQKKAVKCSPPCNEMISEEPAYSAFSLLHLSQYHIMPRTFPLVVIIFAASMGLEQHWGTLRFTMAFLVAALAVLLISAMIHSPPV